MGLEFSFRKLFQVGGSAIVIALAELGRLFGESYLLARLGFGFTFWFTFEIFLIPPFFKSVRSHLNSEMLLDRYGSRLLTRARCIRDGGPLLNPALGLVLQSGDLLWLMADG